LAHEHQELQIQIKLPVKYKEEKNTTKATSTWFSVSHAQLTQIFCMHFAEKKMFIHDSSHCSGIKLLISSIV